MRTFDENYRMQQLPSQTDAQNRACWERDMREIENFIKASDIGPIKNEWLAAIAKVTGE